MHKLIGIILFVAFFTSCRYKDGPVISFHTLHHRIVGTWDVENLTIDGSDVTPKIKTQACYSPLVFTEIGDRGDIYLENNIGHCDIQSSWVLSHDKLKMEWALNYRNGGFTAIGAYGDGFHEWTILKLTNKKMWLKVQDDSGENIIKFNKIK